MCIADKEYFNGTLVFFCHYVILSKKTLFCLDIPLIFFNFASDMQLLHILRDQRKTENEQSVLHLIYYYSDLHSGWLSG